MFVWSEAGLTVDDDKTARAQKIANFLDNLGLKSPENEDIINSSDRHFADVGNRGQRADAISFQTKAIRIVGLDLRADGAETADTDMG